MCVVQLLVRMCDQLNLKPLLAEPLARTIFPICGYIFWTICHYRLGVCTPTCFC